jgi:protocatechuate 3,4-dioxygenase, beta subunit
MRHRFSLFALLLAVAIYGLSCKAQTRPVTTAPPQPAPTVGGPCETCELMWLGMPDGIASTSYSPAWQGKGQRLRITGTVYQQDGRTPAPGVLLYYWHTDAKGLYAPKEGMASGTRRHGHIRGWAKTDSLGRYAIHTRRPAPYPNEALPAHIHVLVKEPGLGQPYYIDDWVFDDDPLLIAHRKKYPFENRGGSGLLRVLLQDSLQVAEDDIVLGLNIPHYPVAKTEISGLPIGQDSPSFGPFHAYGPDKGSRACPVCKYGRYHGILYFVGNRPDWPDIKKWLAFLETESRARGNHLKVYFVYGNENGYSPSVRRTELEALGNSLGLQQVALTFVPSFKDVESEAYLNKINPMVGNTFIVYKHRRIVGKYIDLLPTPANCDSLRQLLEKTKGEYFGLAEPAHR